jgi:hypothetical protein
MRISTIFYIFIDVQAQKFGNSKRYDCKDPSKTHTESREMEPNPSKEIILRFEINLYN